MLEALRTGQPAVNVICSQTGQINWLDTKMEKVCSQISKRPIWPEKKALATFQDQKEKKTGPHKEDRQESF